MQFRLIVLVLVLPVLFLSCHEAGNIAPGGAHLLLTADPQQIGFNGRSTLTVFGTDENGAPLQDGTRVSFFVDQAGTITPNSVSLVQGTGNATYLATFISGEMTITATSGSVQATTTITVADDVEQKVFVSAEPATFPKGGGTSLISAVVTDGSGEPLSGVGVQFSTTSGTLQSGGDFIGTNQNGVANDTLNTTEDATVTAKTDQGFSGATTVRVSAGQIVCHMSINTMNPVVGQTVLFFDTSDDPAAEIARYHWDFGDATSADGRNVEHQYQNSGTFRVVHSVVDTTGNTIFCDPVDISVSP